MLIGIIATVLVLILLVVAFFYVSAYLEAYLEVRNKPREKMGWCYKHGFIRQKHMLSLGIEGHDVCPQCYQMAMKQAGRQS